jgi:tRNA-2-methylthio-N6-dimethylallyladenosine synthase
LLRYYIWTIGCQMNEAESMQIARCLDSAGYMSSDSLRDADLVVLNTCVVRQTAEDKVTGTLGLLKGLQKERPSLSVLVTGCFVEPDIDELKRRFPQVALFFRPGDFPVLIDWLKRQGFNSVMNPQHTQASEEKRPPCIPVPIIQGCNNFCSYCIVPYRRGREISRPLREITGEVTKLVEEGVKEVTLLGQNVNSYGHDLPGRPDLADLLEELNNIAGLARIRFLTNHPRDMSLKLIKTMSSLDKVCEHLNLAVQSGDDNILEAMRRGYTVDYFRELVNTIRWHIPQISLSTDIIVGFPGESDEQFEHTYYLLEDIAFDMVHIAVYSPRPGTLAWRKYKNDIPMNIKKQRFNEIERLQKYIAGRKNASYQGKTVEVLVEGKKRGKWYGRSRNDKITFFEMEEDCEGKILEVEVEKTSPWALQGKVRYNS